MPSLSPRWHRSIREISEVQWTNLVEEPHIPFFSWNWLSELEKSGSISFQYGWQPFHLALWRDEVPVAFAPLYIKNHSFGEFIFDQPFARLAEEFGMNYYPKLLGMSPLSPIQGYRFFIDKEEKKEVITKYMLELIDNFAIQNKILSCNFLYVDDTFQVLLEDLGCAKWLNQKSVWEANGQNNFEDYLASFNANQRRNIKRERKAILESGVSIKAIKGEDLSISLLRKMYAFYEEHCARWGLWGSKYLTRDFFDALASPSLRENVVLFSANRNGEDSSIAMSLCIANQECLWGRYWGTREDLDYLHFETCYYAPLQWALEHGIHTFDPGAGGNHKRRRGFIVKPSVSFHRWYVSSIDSLIRSWLIESNKLMLDEISAVNADLPFSCKGPKLIK